jgi:hypothetical protein
VIGAKVAVAVVAASLTGLPATEPVYEPGPAPQVSFMREDPESGKLRVARHAARTARAPSGETSPAPPRVAAEDDRGTVPNKTVAAVVPDSDPVPRRSAGGPQKHDVTVHTSEPPSAVDEALETTGDLLGS